MTNKKTIFRQVFTSTILIFIILLLIQIFFQAVIFNKYYTSSKVKSIQNEISNLIYNIDNISAKNDLDRIINDFSEMNNTITSIIPFNTPIITNESIFSYMIVRDIYKRNHIILLPRINTTEIFENQKVFLRVYKHKTQNVYLPTYIRVNNDKDIFKAQGINSFLDDIGANFITNFDTDSLNNILGTVKEVNIINNTNDFEIHPSVVSEIVKLSMNNKINIHEYSDGYYYFIENELSNNLIFINVVKKDNLTFGIMTITPIQQTTEISKLIINFNLYVYIIIFIVLIITTYAFSKRITKPLRVLSKKTKKISELDFSESIDVFTNNEVGELASNFQIMSDNLQQAYMQLNEQNKQLLENLELENKLEDERRDFIAGLSHELKTPLAVIQASSEAILNKVFDHEELNKEQINHILDEVNNANKIIHNMLNVYKFDKPTIKNNWSLFNLNELLEYLLEHNKVFIEHKGLTIYNANENYTIHGDKSKIEIVLSNLISNAIKYSPNNANIFIIIKLNDKGINFSIENTGVFINELAINKIFLPFYRVDKARSRATGSTGLGLYIVKQILDQHSFPFGVQNTDRGVKFWFTAINRG